jgi:hypothetical protein
MQDSDDRNPVSSDSEINHVPLHATTAVACTYIVAGWRCFWLLGQLQERRDECVDLIIALIHAPLACGVYPDCLQVSFGSGRKTILSHAWLTFSA